MRYTEPSDAECAIAQALGVVGEWWTLLIVRYGYRLTPMGQGLQLAAALRLPTFRATDAEQHGRGEQDYTAVLAAILDGAAGRRAG